jgi:hypothetical protein
LVKRLLSKRPNCSSAAMNYGSIQAEPQYDNIMADICLGIAVAGVNALVVLMVAALVLI